MALIVFENDHVEKLSPFLSRRHVDVPRYGAKNESKMWRRMTARQFLIHVDQMDTKIRQQF